MKKNKNKNSIEQADNKQTRIQLCGFCPYSVAFPFGCFCGGNLILCLRHNCISERHRFHIILQAVFFFLLQILNRLLNTHTYDNNIAVRSYRNTFIFTTHKRISFFGAIDVICANFDGRLCVYVRQCSTHVSHLMEISSHRM